MRVATRPIPASGSICDPIRFAQADQNDARRFHFAIIVAIPPVDMAAIERLYGLYQSS